MQHWNIDVPEGDILVHAGDLTSTGTIAQLDDFFTWFRELPHRYKVIIAGNHDWLFQLNNARAREMTWGLLYLQDETVTVAGLKFYGSPWQPEFFDWAFNLPRGERLREKWELIPADTDVLLTHGPPRGVGDRTTRGVQAGCVHLLEAVLRIRPRVHLFGHIHEGYGVHRREGTRTIFVNDSICDADYALANKPIVLDM